MQSTGPFGNTQSGQAEGSGVVLSKNGVIVTNAHVVSDATNVRVVTIDHRTFAGTVLGVDTTHDLAVVKVKANDLTPVTVGHSSSLQLGDTVYAIGYPLDLGQTVTRGIVSGLNRTIDVQRDNGSSEHLVGMLQTDAAINPGNSGGALIDSAGQLVGINTAGANAGDAENIGFAISIDSAVPLIRSLAAQSPSRGGSSQQGSTTARAWLGVQVASGSAATQAALAQYGLPSDTKGAVVIGVVSGSPSDGAGVQAGDVIVKLGGTTIGSNDELTSAMSTHKPGDQVQVELLSSSGTRTVTVTLGTFPANLP